MMHNIINQESNDLEIPISANPYHNLILADNKKKSSNRVAQPQPYNLNYNISNDIGQENNSSQQSNVLINIRRDDNDEDDGEEEQKDYFQNRSKDLIEYQRYNQNEEDNQDG